MQQARHIRREAPQPRREAPQPEERSGGRGRQCAFLVIAVAFLALPLLFWFLTFTPVSIPLWLDGRLSNWLEGWAPTIEWPESPGEALDQFRGHELQTTVEDALSQNIPLRAEAMMGSAMLQESAIEASNLGFQWPAYPTFYGSPIYRLTRSGAVRRVYRTPEVPGWEAFAEGLAAFAPEHPDVEFRVYVPAESTDPDVNDALKLISLPAEATDLGEIVRARTADVANVQVLVEDYDDTDAFFEDYFLGDNHWNAGGAVRAYNRIAETLGLDALVTGEEVPYAVPYLGGDARAGRSWVLDEAVDLQADYSALTMDTLDGVRNGDDRSFYEDSHAVEQFTIYYGRYFGSYCGTVENAARDDGSSGILVCDSFGAGIIEPVATAFQHLTALDWFYVDSWGDQSLSEELEATGAKTVIFVATPLDYGTVLEHYPNMFR